MKRRRFFESLTAALLAVLMIGNGLAVAAPPEGKGNNKDGGGGDDSTTATVTYELTFLGTPPGISGARVSDVNNYGEIVGWEIDPTSEFGPSYYRAYLYTALEGFVDINSLPAMVDWPGWTAADASSINDSGQISVLMIDGDGTKAVFLYEPLDETLSKIEVVGNLFIDSSNYSFVNAWGDIAYNKFDTNGTGTWHFYTGGVSTDLGIIGTPSGINAVGDIVGGGYEGCVRYSTLTGELLSLVDGWDALAAKINDSGDICLNVESNGRKRQPARYVEATGVTEILNKTGRIQDINSASDVCFGDNGAIVIATYDLGNVSVDAGLTGTEEDLAKWSSKNSSGGFRMTDRDQSVGLGQICGSAIFDDSTRELWILTPIAVNP